MSLLTQSTTYSALYGKYDHFSVPAYQIKIGSTKITTSSDYIVGEIDLHLSLTQANTLTFTLCGQYQYDSSGFSSSVKRLLQVGETVELSLGYGSTLTLLFRGYIGLMDVEFDMDEGIFFQITAFDARRLMQDDNRSFTLSENQNYSEAVSELMSRYRSLCSFSCEATTDHLSLPMGQCQSDYDFITQHLIGQGRAEREFFILGDTAYYRAVGGGHRTPVLTLGVSQGLKSFRGSFQYVHTEIQVQGYDHGKDDVPKGSATAKGDNQTQAISPGTILVLAEDCQRDSQAKDRAKALATRLESQAVQSQGSCVGLPEIVPGRYLAIEKTDSTVNRSYYLTQVNHRMSSQGYLTVFMTKG